MNELTQTGLGSMSVSEESYKQEIANLQQQLEIMGLYKSYQEEAHFRLVLITTLQEITQTLKESLNSLNLNIKDLKRIQATIAGIELEK